MAPSQFSLLKTRRFLPLFLTQFLGAFNDNVFKNALALSLIYGIAGKSVENGPVLATAAAGLFILPFLLFSAIAGQMADKFDKSHMIRIIKLVEMALMLAAAAGFYFGHVTLLMIVLFFMGVHSAFFGPLKYSILPQHLNKDELIGGNALVEAGTFVAILTGTILSGILVLQDSGISYIIIATVSCAMLGWMSSRAIPAAQAAAPGLVIGWNFAIETIRVMRYAKQDRVIYTSILGISWFWLVGFTFLSQFPAYAKNALGADGSVVTLFLTVFSLGVALGSLICNKLLKGKVSDDHVPLGAFGMALSMLVFWLVSPRGAAASDKLIGVSEFLIHPQGMLIIASLCAVAIFGGIYIVPLYALMQTRSEEAYRSRTIAANNIMNALFMVAGAGAVMGLLKAGLVVTDIFLVTAIAALTVAIISRHYSHR